MYPFIKVGAVYLNPSHIVDIVDDSAEDQPDAMVVTLTTGTHETYSHRFVGDDAVALRRYLDPRSDDVALTIPPRDRRVRL